MEMLNRSIRRPLDLSEKLGLEPFATVPYIRTAGEVRRKRSLVVLALVLIAVAIPAALFAVHTLYLPLDLVFSELLAKVGLGGRRALLRRFGEREERWNASRPPSRKPRNSGSTPATSPGPPGPRSPARAGHRHGRQPRRPRGGGRGRPGPSSRPSSPTRELLARNRIVTFADTDPAHATFDMMRTKILRMLRQNGWTSVAITSPTNGCGKTTAQPQPRLQPQPPAGRAHGAGRSRPAPPGGRQGDRAHEAAVDGERAAGHPAGGGELRALRREPRHRHQRHGGARLLRAPAERGHRPGRGRASRPRSSRT